MRITFLGTAGSAPTKLRNLPSIAIEHNGQIYLFDCGEGTQRQMLQFSVNISRVKTIFLTHTHGDHVIGLAGLVRTFALNNRTNPLEIYVPQGGEKIVNSLINFDNAVINYKIIIKPIKTGQIYKGKDFTIAAFQLLHTTRTVGFIFKENDKLHFLKPKIKQLKMKGEQFRALLKNGSIKIGTRNVRLSEVTVKKEGRKIVYATDTRPTKEAIKAATNADVFIHESTFSEEEVILAKKRYHSTATEVAGLAKKARAKRLILTHPSARYKDPDILAKESSKIFKNTIMARDGLVINL